MSVPPQSSTCRVGRKPHCCLGDRNHKSSMDWRIARKHGRHTHEPTLVLPRIQGSGPTPRHQSRVVGIRKQPI